MIRSSEYPRSAPSGHDQREIVVIADIAVIAEIGNQIIEGKYQVDSQGVPVPWSGDLVSFTTDIGDDGDERAITATLLA